MDTRIESFTFSSGTAAGATLVLMGAVHGNEKCGALALERLVKRLESKEIGLKSGTLIVVPIANPEAYAANKRFIERNLNRSLYPKPPEERKAYEDHLDHQLCAVLDQADYLLDIHSYTAGGAPFAIISGHDSEENKFARALGVTGNFVWGWKDAFRDSGIPEKESQGTTEYVRSKGGRAMTLECGQHDDPDNADIAYAAALRAMEHLGLVEAAVVTRELSALHLPVLKQGQFAKMVTVIRNNPDTRLAKEFRHFEPIKSGEIMAFSGDGKTITAPADGYAILPNPKAAKGAEMLYFGIEEEPLSGTAAKKTPTSRYKNP